MAIDGQRIRDMDQSIASASTAVMMTATKILRAATGSIGCFSMSGRRRVLSPSPSQNPVDEVQEVCEVSLLCLKPSQEHGLLEERS